ncbi:MAG: acetyl-CoA decarbonylase/synthase complex subunit delta [Chloroflexota bacterium]
MAFEIPKTSYSGKIKEVTFGKGNKAVTLGGESAYPFYLFEGKMPHLPRIAMEVWDCPPDDWPETALEPFKGVTNDPAAWAKKCVNDYGAEMICLQLISTDPNGLNRSADEAAQVVKKVADAIDVPLIVWGTSNEEKDTDVLRKVSEVCQDKSLIIGPVAEKNHKRIGAAAIGYKHTVIASTPIDINLAKQLNILLGNLGVPDELIVMDPTVSGIGYGLEYAYSVMERMRMAALTQQDDKLQFPIICNVSKEVWKTKEMKDEDPKLGDVKKRGILIEAMSAMALLLAGADVLIMRHPDAIKLMKDTIGDLAAP